MKYIVGDYCISLELESVPLFSLTVDDKRHFSTYKAEFDFNIVAKDVKQFEALMKKFFEGKYFFQIEKDAVGLELSFKIVVDEIVMKEFNLQLPLHHKLTEKEEHTARIHQLEEEVAKMRKRLNRLELFMEHAIGDPNKEVMFCYLERNFDERGLSKKYGQYALRSATSINLDFSKHFFTAKQVRYLLHHIENSSPCAYNCISCEELTSADNWTNNFILGQFFFVEEFEISNYRFENLDVIFNRREQERVYSSDTIKTIKFTSCPKLKQVDISKEWWNVKTIIFEGCSDIDFEYLFDGKERCPLKCIVLMDRTDRLFERYFTRLQEIGILLRRGY